MTDLTPNDLSHMSDEDFNALCPQGEHAPGPAQPLSPAALTVWDQFCSIVEDHGPPRLALAAALRAAVAHTQQHRGHDVWECDADELLAIAAELEAWAAGERPVFLLLPPS